MENRKRSFSASSIYYLGKIYQGRYLPLDTNFFLKVIVGFSVQEKSDSRATNKSFANTPVWGGICLTLNVSRR